MLYVNNTKLICMSATLQGDLFTQYFIEPLKIQPENPIQPIFVGIQRFKVDQIFLEDIPEKFNLSSFANTTVTETVAKFAKKAKWPPKTEIDRRLFELCRDLIRKCAKGGKTILIFLPGMNEIENIIDVICVLENNIPGDRIELIPLHSRLSPEEQQRAFQSPDINTCHVVVATSIAESAITLPEVNCVIDFGLQRELFYDMKRKMSSFRLGWCSHAAAKQRAGRTGRLCHGKVIRFYTKPFFNEGLSRFDLPEMKKAPLSKTVLKVKYINQHTFPGTGLKELFSRVIQPPEESQIDSALKLLATLGAISKNSEDASVTMLGCIVTELPVDVAFGRLIVYGALFGMTCDAVVMAASLSCQTPFSIVSRAVYRKTRKFVHKAKQSLKTRLRYDEEFSAPIMVRNLFVDWLKYKIDNQDKHHGRSDSLAERFCKDKSVNPKRLVSFEIQVLELLRAIKRFLEDPTEKSLVRKLIIFLEKTERNEERRIDNVSQFFHQDPLVLKALLIASFPTNIAMGDAACHVKEKKYPETKEQMEEKKSPEIKEQMKKRKSPEKKEKMKKTKALETKEQMQTHGFNAKKSVKLIFQKKTRVEEVLDELNNFIHISKSECLGKEVLMEFDDVLGNEDFFNVKEFVDKRRFTHKIVERPPPNIHEVPYCCHILNMIASGREKFSITSKHGTKDNSKKDIEGPLQPYLVTWMTFSDEKEDTPSVAGRLEWRDPVGFLCDTRDTTAGLLAVAPSIVGTNDQSFAWFDGLTVLPTTTNGCLTWIFLMCFLPERQISVYHDIKTGVICGLKVFNKELLLSSTEQPILRLDDLTEICAIRQEAEMLLKGSEGVRILKGNIEHMLGKIITEIKGRASSLRKGKSKWQNEGKEWLKLHDSQQSKESKTMKKLHETEQSDRTTENNRSDRLDVSNNLSEEETRLKYPRNKTGCSDKSRLGSRHQPKNGSGIRFDGTGDGKKPTRGKTKTKKHNDRQRSLVTKNPMCDTQTSSQNLSKENSALECSRHENSGGGNTSVGSRHGVKNNPDTRSRRRKEKTRDQRNEPKGNKEKQRNSQIPISAGDDAEKVGKDGLLLSPETAAFTSESSSDKKPEREAMRSKQANFVTEDTRTTRLDISQEDTTLRNSRYENSHRNNMNDISRQKDSHARPGKSKEKNGYRRYKQKGKKREHEKIQAPSSARQDVESFVEGTLPAFSAVTSHDTSNGKKTRQFNRRRRRGGQTHVMAEGRRRNPPDDSHNPATDYTMRYENDHSDNIVASSRLGAEQNSQALSRKRGEKR